MTTAPYYLRLTNPKNEAVDGLNRARRYETKEEGQRDAVRVRGELRTVQARTGGVVYTCVCLIDERQVRGLQCVGYREIYSREERAALGVSL